MGTGKLQDDFAAIVACDLASKLVGLSCRRGIWLTAHGHTMTEGVLACPQFASP